jgi:hypothetical protein
MNDNLYYLAIVFCAVISLGNWRAGLYLCLIFDVLRDPVRKTSPGSSVAITIAGASLWMAVAAGAYAARGEGMLRVARQYPRIWSAFLILLLGMAPAAIMSVVLYPGGYRLAAVGFVSYTAPFLGMALGYLFLTKPAEVLKLMGFYCLVNGIALSGTLFEFFGYDVPALGGIKMTWLRYETGYTVKLICGFYRSPDVMGLHAAFVAMFGVILALTSRSRVRWLWFSFTIWAATCLILSGRRKMIAMLLVFVAVYVWLKLRQTGASALLGMLAALLAVGGGAYILMQQVDVHEEYVEYAGTTLTKAGERIRTNVVGEVIHSAQTTGIFGYGLGTATQGSHYAGLHGQRVWQEDGASRVFAEVGWLGAILFGIALWQLLRVLFRVLVHLQWRRDIGDLMFGIAGIVAACAGSFIVSHQAFSGDPAALMLTSFLVGCFLAGPQLPMWPGVNARQTLAGPDVRQLLPSGTL